MSSDKIPACWDVLCFVDKAIIHHYALDSKNSLFISGICFICTVTALVMSFNAFITNYCGVSK